MKFSFKRFLSSALAAVMTVSVLSVGMVSSVSAAAQNYNFADLESVLSSFDYKTGGNITTGLDYIAGSASWQKDAEKGTGVKLGGASTSTRRMFVVEADEGETITATFCGQTDSAVPDCVIANSADGMVKDGTPEPGVYARAEGNGYASASVSLIAGSGTAQKYYIGSPGLKSTITSITVGTATYADGTVTYNSPENGTVTVMNGASPVVSGTKVTGGTQLTLKAIPDEGYVASVKINSSDKKLSADNTVNFTVNGNVVIEVSFLEYIGRTPITSSVTYDAGNKDTESLVLPNGGISSGIYYFDLAPNCTIETGKRINIGGSNDGSQKSILFSTGDLKDKTAEMTLSFASSGDTARTVQLGKIVDGTGSVYNSNVGTTAGGAADKGIYHTSEPVVLEGNTDYFLSTAGSTIYINKIEIKVTEIAEPSPVTVGSTTANGKTYVFAGVKDGHQTDSGNLVVYGSSTETTAEGIQAKKNVVLETGTVYSSVDGVATPEGVEGYVFAQEVTNSKGTDINLVAVLGDYVSAVGKVSFN